MIHVLREWGMGGGGGERTALINGREVIVTFCASAQAFNIQVCDK